MLARKKLSNLFCRKIKMSHLHKGITAEGSKCFTSEKHLGLF
jgi:hypothetical protein